MAEIAITSEQKVHVKLNPTTAAGSPSSLDGAATFAVESGDATVEPDADGLGAYLISGAAGVSVISVSADADLGEGVVTITDSITLTVSDPFAANLGLVVDAPEPK